MQQDPLGYVDGASLYEYEQSVPNISFDPYGTQRWYENWGPAVKAMFGMADPEVQEGFDKSNWDRTNGTIGGLTYNKADMAGLHGGDPNKMAHTFDPSAREQNRCFSQCVGNALASALPANMTGLNLNPFGTTDSSDNPCGNDWNSFEGSNFTDWSTNIAPSAASMVGDAIDQLMNPAKYKTVYYGRKTASGMQRSYQRMISPSGGWPTPQLSNSPVKSFRPSDTAKSFQMANEGGMMSRLGGALNAAMYAKSLDDCRKKCFDPNQPCGK